MNYIRTLGAEMARQIRMLKTLAGWRRFLLDTAVMWAGIAFVAHLSWQSLVVSVAVLTMAGMSWLAGQTTRQALITGASAGFGLVSILYLPYLAHLLAN